MAAVALRSEERIGLGAAIAAHIALVALLLWGPPAADVVIPPDRIEVTISDEVGLTSTSPEPMAEAAPDAAPEIGEPAPAEPQPAPPAPRVEAPRPQPAVQPRPEPPRPEPPRPVPRSTPRPAARPAVRPAPAPAPKAAPAPRPAPKAPARPAARPTPAAKTNARPATRPSAAAATRPAARPGASRFADAFKEGVPGARSTGAARNPPAQAAGPQVQASLMGAISRELKPHLQGKMPEGADAEKLVTILRWTLNRDGSLAGPVQFVRQDGQTDANRAQWERHKEQAIRAVQLAAPFDLPAEYYDAWKRVGPIRFDKRLAQ